MAEGNRLQQCTSRQRSLLPLVLRLPATLQPQQPQVCQRASACLLPKEHPAASGAALEPGVCQSCSIST